MKFYLLISLFFLSSFCFPVLGFTQETSATSHSLPTESPSSVDSSTHERSDESILTPYPDHNETLPTWPDHVERESDTFEAKFFNMLLILGLLIGFMMLASWALKRMMKTKMTQLNTTSYIKVLETRYLSPRASLYLVEIQDQTFLIAESPTSVTHLATLALEDVSESEQQ